MSPSRRANQLRSTKIQRYPTAAPGSALITQGGTRVICTASVETEVPRFLIDRESGQARQGWVTAEYAMLPGSTPDRKKRGINSRATEIQRLIGRSLRAAVDLRKMSGITVTCDCDVLVADGGTRSASITGAFVAMSLALEFARKHQMIDGQPIKGPVAAVSVGLINGRQQLDLDYDLDSQAAVDMNVAMNYKGEFVEVQGTAEGAAFGRDQLDGLLDLATRGIRQLMRIQRAALRTTQP